MRARSFLTLIFASGCSALIEPDPSRLGVGDDAGAVMIDAGQERDAGRDRDAGEVPDEDAGATGSDAGMIPEVDAGCTTAPSCADGVITTCDGESMCPLGCATTGAPECARMIPSNVSESLWRDDARSVDIPASSDAFGLDTTMCMARMADSMVVMQADGSEVCALIVHDLTIRAGAALVVSGSRPLVVMASGDVVIEEGGALDVSARLARPGAGGGIGATHASPAGGRSPGENGTHAGTFADGGGGGGGFCGNGGNGGTGGAAVGGDGGDAMPIVDLIPLRGGSGGGLGEGGRPSNAPGNVGIGGGGGGAIQISALGTITIDGVILAGGGGGSGGGNSATFVNYGAGGGGGSGGGVLLEAPTIEIGMRGGVTTSGGGGGGGANGSAPGGPGQNGGEVFTEADGGERGGLDLGAFGGSSGGGRVNDGTDGASNTRSSANGGGGGGSVGCVVYRTGNGEAPANARMSTSGSEAPALTIARVFVR
jgi:hypothetical protein